MQKLHESPSFRGQSDFHKRFPWNLPILVTIRFHLHPKITGQKNGARKRFKIMYVLPDWSNSSQIFVFRVLCFGPELVLLKRKLHNLKKLVIYFLSCDRLYDWTTCLGNLFPGEKRHININFLLWLTSRWPWDKRLVVPGLTGPKSLCVRLETQEI